MAAYAGDAMSLILYDNPASTNAHKVRFLLAELDLEAEIRVMPLHAPTVAYRKVHPFGLIPTLVDGDFVITESNVDCALAGRLHFAQRLGLDPDCAPRLLRALRAVQTRPAWTAAIGSQAA